LLGAAKGVAVIVVVGLKVFAGLLAALAGLLCLGLGLWVAGLGLAWVMCIL